jgi:hypothetical protein
MPRKLQLLVLMFAATSVVKASPVTWYLHDVIAGNDPCCAPFRDYVWGDFTYDVDTGSVLGWHVSLGAVDGLFPALDNAEPCCGADFSSVFWATPTLSYLDATRSSGRIPIMAVRLAS